MTNGTSLRATAAALAMMGMALSCAKSNVGKDLDAGSAAGTGGSGEGGAAAGAGGASSGSGGASRGSGGAAAGSGGGGGSAGMGAGGAGGGPLVNACDGNVTGTAANTLTVNVDSAQNVVGNGIF